MTQMPDFQEPTDAPEDGLFTMDVEHRTESEDTFPIPPYMVAVMNRLDTMEARLDALTGAVNQFGAMLQHIVNTVSSAGQMLSEKGIGGLMGLMGGGKNG
jgi:hypothetical protein